MVVDLMAHTRGARGALAALGVAPILLNYLGYAGTAGGGHYDYAMVDARIAPPEDAVAAWAEALIVLPHCYCGPDATRRRRCDCPGGAADGKVNLCNVSIAAQPGESCGE